jgi:hypothetical protein
MVVVCNLGFNVSSLSLGGIKGIVAVHIDRGIASPAGAGSQ